MAAKLPKLTPKQTQMAVAGVVLLGVGGFVYFKYFWKPISERIATARTNIEEVEGKISKAKAQAARLPQIQRELVVLNQQAADAEKRLPKSKDVPAVIDTVSALSKKYQVKLTSFAPGGQAARQFFIEVPYALTVSGSFHEIGRFFAAIALEERIFNVKGVAFSRLGDKLSVAFTLVSYQYKG